MHPHNYMPHGQHRMMHQHPNAPANQVYMEDSYDEMGDMQEEIDDLYVDEEVDSDGEPLPTEQEVITIINSIPSFKFEEKPPEISDTASEASTTSRRKSAADSITERKRKEIKRTQNEVQCSICLEVLRSGN